MTIRITVRSACVDRDMLAVVVESTRDELPGVTLRWQQTFALGSTVPQMQTMLNDAATKLWLVQQNPTWTVP